MGNKLVKGQNDLATVFPAIALYYDTKKNGNTASDIQAKSNKAVWWTCDKGHSFSMTVLNRVRREKSCPYCSGQKLLTGFNDLQTVHPTIAEEWDYSKNEGSPADYRYGSGYKAWWICKKCGVSYQSPINVHIQGHKCPYCMGNKVVIGKTDLQSLFPDIAKEYAEDNLIPVNQIAAGSHMKVKWICPHCGQTYLAAPHSRTAKINTECPLCKKQSKGERRIQKILKEYGIDFKTQEWFDNLRAESGKPLMFDFTLYHNNKLVGAIEYNGKQHYQPIEIFGGNEAYKKQTKRDHQKIIYCLQHGVPILTIAYARCGMTPEQEVENFIHNLKLI